MCIILFAKRKLINDQVVFCAVQCVIVIFSNLPTLRRILSYLLPMHMRACVFVCILALRDCCMMCPFPASILQWEVAAEFVHMLISSHLLMCKSNVASRIFIVSVRAGLDNPGFGKMRVCLVHMRCK